MLPVSNKRKCCASAIFFLENGLTVIWGEAHFKTVFIKRLIEWHQIVIKSKYVRQHRVHFHSLLVNCVIIVQTKSLCEAVEGNILSFIVKWCNYCSTFSLTWANGEAEAESWWILAETKRIHGETEKTGSSRESKPHQREKSIPTTAFWKSVDIFGGSYSLLTWLVDWFVYNPDMLVAWVEVTCLVVLSMYLLIIIA